MLVKQETFDLLILAKIGCPFLLVTYVALRCGSYMEDLLVTYEYYVCIFDLGTTELIQNFEEAPISYGLQW